MIVARLKRIKHLNINFLTSELQSDQVTERDPEPAPKSEDRLGSALGAMDDVPYSVP